LSPIINIENLSFDMGAHLLLKKSLFNISPQQKIYITGSSEGWKDQLMTWCRQEGHSVHFEKHNQQEIAVLVKGTKASERWTQSEKVTSISEEAKGTWGLAARGATIEAGGPDFHFRLNKKSEIWASNAAELYKQALAAQWNPEIAIEWSSPMRHSQDLEVAVVQVMTYMIENENAALLIPAKFLSQLHPHYREVQALLAIQIADEARHIEVFTRRIQLYGSEPALSTVGGQLSLKTLLDEHDFSVAEFLLSVLGEGTFVDLLQFLTQYAPDPVTKQICLLAGRDESRHVSFGISHLKENLEKNPESRTRLANAIELRFDTLANSSGLNSEVFDALILIAAGTYSPSALANGFKAVQTLMKTMEEGRRVRLEKLGFTNSEAKRLAGLHTRNFM